MKLRFAIYSALLAGAAAGFAAAVRGPTSRLGALLGVGSAAAAGAISYAFIVRARPTAEGVLRAMVVGFFSRMVLVALGLALAMRLDAGPLAFAIGFFLLFFGQQALEIRSVQLSARQVEGKA